MGRHAYDFYMESETEEVKNYIRMMLKMGEDNEKPI